MRPSVIILIAIGALILVGYGVVGVEIARRAMGTKDAEPIAATSAEAVRQVALDLEEGSRIVGMVSTADRVVLHVAKPNAPDRIVVVDPKSLAVGAGSRVSDKK